jgi:hypothetical protein
MRIRSDKIDAYKGKLKGKYVLLTKPNKLNAYFTPPASRTSDSALLVMANAEAAAPGTRRNELPTDPAAESCPRSSIIRSGNSS